MNKIYLNIEKGRVCAEYYLDEIEKLRSKKVISSEKLYLQYLKLSVKWLGEKNRCYLTKGFDAYLSNILSTSLEKYKPVPFKVKVKRFVSNFIKIQ